jgi:hypothetical protein
MVAHNHTTFAIIQLTALAFIENTLKRDPRKKILCLERGGKQSFAAMSSMLTTLCSPQIFGSLITSKTCRFLSNTLLAAQVKRFLLLCPNRLMRAISNLYTALALSLVVVRPSGLPGLQARLLR